MKGNGFNACLTNDVIMEHNVLHEQLTRTPKKVKLLEEVAFKLETLLKAKTMAKGVEKRTPKFHGGCQML
jgi:hypothetical protein